MQTHIQHSEVTDDQHISMRSIRVVFADQCYNFETKISGTRRSIVAYYSRRDVVVWCPVTNREQLLQPMRIEFLPQNDSGQTIVCQIGN